MEEFWKEKWGFKVLGLEKRGNLAAEIHHEWKKFFHAISSLQWYLKFHTQNNGSLRQAWASIFGNCTVEELKIAKWRFKVLGFERGGILAAEKKREGVFDVSSPLQWYQKFRNNDNGSLQQA